jgi:hypothetical protein
MFGLSSFAGVPFAAVGPTYTYVTGVSAEGLVGSVTTTAAANVSPSGVSADGLVGSVAIFAAANTNVSGVSADGLTGDARTKLSMLPGWKPAAM